MLFVKSLKWWSNKNCIVEYLIGNRKFNVSHVVVIYTNAVTTPAVLGNMCVLASENDRLSACHSVTAVCRIAYDNSTLCYYD